jgi:hypothetical protein
MAATVTITIKGRNDAKGPLAEAERGVRGLGNVAEDTGRRFSAFSEIAVGALRRVGEIATNAAL